MAILTPAIASIQKGEVLPDFAYEMADRVLIKEGVDPLTAFIDAETNRHHRAEALTAISIVKGLVDKCITTETEGK